MSFFDNTRKPAGLGGRLMVSMMNVGHRAASCRSPRTRGSSTAAAAGAQT